MRLLVSAGGTGGHVYPALSVIEALRAAQAGTSRALAEEGAKAVECGHEGLRVLWVGSLGGIEEEMVTGSGVEFVGLPSGGLRGMGPWTALRNGTRIVGSIGPARRILRGFRPDVVMVTGGYACAPVTLASRTMRVPVLIYLPDIVPGLAIRFLSRFAAVVAVTSEESTRYLAGRKTVVTGYPVRPDIQTTDREQARRLFGLDPSWPTLLIFGGSRGARSLNQAVVAGLRELLPLCQIVHVSGKLDSERVAMATRDLPDGLGRRYQHHAYLTNMPAALVAADLVVARAGAATMGEFPAAGLPAILVPYPHSGKHQEPNADHMARHGAARVVADEALSERLVPTIRELLANPEVLSSMRSASKALDRPDAAARIGQQACLLAQQHLRDGKKGVRS